MPNILPLRENMADLSTSFMGISLKNPFIVGASTLTADMATLKALEEKGAAAVVIRSLFEEQVQSEAFQMDEELEMYDDKHPEHADMMPSLRHSGPNQHIYWVKRAVNELRIPVIASVNAINMGAWAEYSKLLAGTGIAGLELNLYSPVTDPEMDPRTMETDHLRVLKIVRESIDIPIGVKIGHSYTNPLNVIRSMDGIADGFVLFNRFMEPSIDIETFKPDYGYNLSNPSDHKVPLRYTGLISGLIGSDICASGGIHSGEDAARMVLAGASAVQTVSSLYKNGLGHLSDMVASMDQWMDRKGFASVRDIQGRLSKERSPDPEAYTRAHYIRSLKMAPAGNR